MWIQTKIWQITRPGIAIRQKLVNSKNICVWTYEKGPQIICLDPESNTYILDDYHVIGYHCKAWKMCNE